MNTAVLVSCSCLRAAHPEIYKIGSGKVRVRFVNFGKLCTRDKFCVHK